MMDDQPSLPRSRDYGVTSQVVMSTFNR